ncbi:MAG: hypothetical protein HEEMFOPI_01050 [Holosporales bacterium]
MVIVEKHNNIVKNVIIDCVEAIAKLEPYVNPWYSAKKNL